MLKLQLNREIIIVILSISVQVPLAVFLGHYYDERSFIDTGYLVSSGLNPYQPHLITIFSSNPDLTGINPIIGYPPLWPLLLGLIYRLTYNITPNIFLYNFAIKIPVIASNIGLAYVTKSIMLRLGEPEKKIRAAWLFLLFNPFILLTTAAWGEFDTLIALLCIASLYFLSKGMMGKSALLLSLSIVLKPISFPLIGLPLLFLPTKNWRKISIYILICFVTVAIFWFLLFNLLGWMAPSSGSEVTSYFRMAGGMTVFNIVEIFQNTATLPAGLGFLGYLWIPALLLGYYFVYRNPPRTFVELTQKAVGLLLIFFLSRTWLSEPNINLILALLLILVSVRKIGSRSFHLLWILALVFMVLNFAFPQLFFLVYPQIIPALAHFDAQFRTARLVARFAVTVLWYIIAVKTLSETMKK